MSSTGWIAVPNRSNLQLCKGREVSVAAVMTHWSLAISFSSSSHDIDAYDPPTEKSCIQLNRRKTKKLLIKKFNRACVTAVHEERSDLSWNRNFCKLLRSDTTQIALKKPRVDHKIQGVIAKSAALKDLSDIPNKIFLKYQGNAGVDALKIRDLIGSKWPQSKKPIPLSRVALRPTLRG